MSNVLIFGRSTSQLSEWGEGELSVMNQWHSENLLRFQIWWVVNCFYFFNLIINGKHHSIFTELLKVKIYEINERLKLWERLPIAFSTCPAAAHLGKWTLLRGSRTRALSFEYKLTKLILKIECPSYSLPLRGNQP